MLQTSICARAPAGNGSGWNDARVDLLRKLWADGLSASQIAGRLGEVTRNAVIGKVHRLGLPLRGKTGRPRGYRPASRPVLRRPPAPKTPRPPRTPAPAAAAFLPLPAQLDLPLGERVTVRTLKPSHCRWPFGDPKLPGFHFCGRRKAEGHPYCSHHAVFAFNPAAKRRWAA